jgi:hypothetical protein
MSITHESSCRHSTSLCINLSPGVYIMERDMGESGRRALPNDQEGNASWQDMRDGARKNAGCPSWGRATADPALAYTSIGPGQRGMHCQLRMRQPKQPGAERQCRQQRGPASCRLPAGFQPYGTHLTLNMEAGL